MIPVLDYLLEDTLWKLDTSRDPTFKSSALNLLVQIWLQNPSKINDKNQIGNEIIWLLQWNCKEGNKAMKITCIALLFELLD